MALYTSFANRPWHTVTSFEYQTRLMVGASTYDHITADVWCECRESAEAYILSNLKDGQRPLRSMLNRIPGELMPQWGHVMAAGDISYTVMIPNLVTTPTSRMPILWKNLDCYWEDRYSVDPREYGTEYTISGNVVTIIGASKGDVYTFEYETTLTPTPTVLKSLSIYQTAGNALIAKYGSDHARVQQWADMYGVHVQRQVEMLRTGNIEIPELAAIRLYSDWNEDLGDISSIPMARM